MNAKPFYATVLAAALTLPSTAAAQEAKGHPFLCKAKLLPPVTAAVHTTKRFTQDEENDFAALTEEGMHSTMKTVIREYKPEMPIFTSDSTAVEYGTTDNRVRIETRINRKTGTISADFTSEALTFGYHDGKATIATQATATAHTDNIFDPKATQTSLSAVWNEGKRAPNAEAQAATVMMLVDTFQTYMTDATPMYMETRPEGFYEGKIEAGVIDAAKIKNQFTTPPSPMP